MLKKTETFASFAVDDIERARTFYADTLELDVTAQDGMLSLATGGDSGVMVYSKPDHAAANFTVFNIPVDDIETTVDELCGRGVAFEQYDMAQIKTDEKGISRGHGMAMAWFKDPSGNIVSVLEMAEKT